MWTMKKRALSKAQSKAHLLFQTPLKDALAGLGDLMKATVDVSKDIAQSQLDLATAQVAHERQVRRAEVRLLSKAAAAKRLGIGDATLSYLIKSKQLSPVKVGKKRVKIPARDVERLATEGFKREP
jgi:excisionase family DNA binding protein